MWEQLLARIRANDPTLTMIDLYRKNIGAAGAQALAEALKTNTSVTSISLWNNAIGAAGAQALAEALKTNTSVTKIELYENNIGAAGAQALANALKTNTSLTSIGLNHNKIGDAGKQAVQQIMAYTSRNKFEKLLPRIRANDPNLTTIDLIHKAIGAAGANALAEALKTNTSVTAIDFYYNDIGDAGAQALAEVLKTNTSVTEIYLYSNNIGDAGAQGLAEALKVNTSVTEISLRVNKIGAAGAQALAEALKTNTSVTSIYLSNNKIGDAGTQAFAEALKTNTSVTTIDLMYNNIGDAGAQALVEALKTINSVTEIDLSDNNIGAAGAQALAEALKTNNSVTAINLHCNNFADAVKTQLNEYLNRNRTNAKKLIDAVQNNDSTAVKELIAVGVSVNYQDEKDKTALHYAIQEGRLEIVYLLLNSPQLSKNKTAPSLVNEFSNENGNTLLHQAVLFAENNPEIAHKLVERLLAFGAKRYVKNHAGQYPFQLCIPATTEENPELAIIRNLLKPTPAEQLFIDHIVNNPHIKPLIEKLSKTLVAMDDLMVTLRSDKTKHKYQLPGDLGVRLLFEELQLFRTHIEQDDFDCENKSAWDKFLKISLSNYQNMTNNLPTPQISGEAEILTDEQSALVKELILKLQQINQLIFQDTQASSHRDKLIQNICIPREWVEEYELPLAETQTSKKRKRETEDSNADGIATADNAEELSAKRQKTDDFSVEDLQKKIRELEQNLVLSQTEITELKQKLAKAEAAKDSENTSSHSVAFFPTLQK